MSVESPLLRARGVGRSFGEVVALEGVDLDLGPGESVALLGPNGAGKTTLLTILAGVARATAGSVDAAAGIGWAPHVPAVYRRLSVRENLELFASLEGVADPAGRARELIARADLNAVAGRRAAALSTGTLQRLNLAVALAGAPDALLIDEPTGTLSPDQRQRLWSWLDELRGEGLAVLFSTQSVGEATGRAGRIVILRDGRTAFSGAPGELAAPGDWPGLEAAVMRLLGAPA